LPTKTSTPRSRSSQSTDAIVVLKDDHREIKRLFADFQRAGDSAEKTKQRLVDRIIELLTVHTYIENEVMYPRVRALLPDLEDDMSASDERFDAKTTVLIENVTHHIDEEEQEWFPQVRQGLGRKELQQIGQEMLVAKKSAPRRPSQPSALKKTIDAVIS
jgi:hemerythrin superfamily protein